ncbi:50S ribosomal protein L29 [Candidatus Uhrbacteria bacterium]|jgi:ribosomal protein L29|nr:50S ribosomal protein L29 [Candidatus Uhrbacteria bacterium]
MLFKDLNKKSVTELGKMLSEEKAKLYDLRLKISVNQLKEVRQVRVTRKRIAQLMTRISQLSNAEAPAKVTE